MLQWNPVTIYDFSRYWIDALSVAQLLSIMAVFAHLKDVLSPTQLAALQTIFSRRDAGPALDKRIAELRHGPR